eukprot:253876-Amphidinium_carterae.2
MLQFISSLPQAWDAVVTTSESIGEEVKADIKKDILSCLKEGSITLILGSIFQVLHSGEAVKQQRGPMQKAMKDLRAEVGKDSELGTLGKALYDKVQAVLAMRA